MKIQTENQNPKMFVVKYSILEDFIQFHFPGISLEDLYQGGFTIFVGDDRSKYRPQDVENLLNTIRERGAARTQFGVSVLCLDLWWRGFLDEGVYFIIQDEWLEGFDK